MYKGAFTHNFLLMYLVQFSLIQSLSRVWLCDPMLHTRPPCPSSAPGVHPNSCPLSRWHHPAIHPLSSTFSSCLQSLPASDSVKGPWASPVVLVVKNPPANAGGIRDTGSICRLENLLEEGMATHSNILAWRMPWTEVPDWSDLACTHAV